MREVIGEYLEVELITEGEKTNIYSILNKNFNISLGIIKWNGKWRQYCFYPESERVFSIGCMQDISKFIIKLREERKNKKE
jgi:hypothetical protein